MDRPGDRQGQHRSTTIADLKGKRVAVTRGTDPHIFLVRALQSAGLTERTSRPSCCSIPTARPRSFAATSTPGPASIPMMAQAEVVDGAKLFYRKAGGQHLGHPQRARGLRSRTTRTWCAACSRSTRRRAKISLANYDELKRVFIAVDQAARGRRRQAAEGAHRAHAQPHRRAAARVDPGSGPRPAAGGRGAGQRRRDSATVDALIDDHFITASN